MYICIYVYMYICIYVYMYICTYVYIVDYIIDIHDISRFDQTKPGKATVSPKVPLADWIERRIGGEIELQEAIASRAWKI